MQSTSATVKDVRVYESTDCGSDHYLDKTIVRWNWYRIKQKIPTEYTEVEYWNTAFKGKFLQDEIIKGICEKTAKDRLNKDFESFEDDINKSKIKY